MRGVGHDFLDRSHIPDRPDCSCDLKVSGAEAVIADMAFGLTAILLFWAAFLLYLED